MNQAAIQTAATSSSGVEQFAAVSTIFDAVEIALYVADMETYELLFLNAYGLSVWARWLSLAAICSVVVDISQVEFRQLRQTRSGQEGHKLGCA